MDAVTSPSSFSRITTIHDENEDVCEPLAKSFLNGVMALPALVALENLFVLLAMLSYKEKLNKRSLNMYVASTLLANFLLSILTFYHFLNYYYGFEPYQPNLWWAFRKGLTLSMSLVIAGNIGLLIYGIDDNTYIVGRVSNISPKSSNLSPIYRRRKAILLIFTVWLIPIVYGGISMISWNCTQGQCTCTLRYKSNKPICPDDSCSHLYTPMAKSYLFSIALILTLECLGLIIFIIKSVFSLKRKESSNGSVPVSLCLVFRKYARIHRLVIYLFCIFAICTTPSNVLIILDFVFAEINISHEVVNFILPLPLLYSLIGPILIYRQQSDIQGAVSNLLTLCCSCKAKSKLNKPNSKFQSKNKPTNLPMTEKKTVP